MSPTTWIVPVRTRPAPSRRGRAQTRRGPRCSPAGRRARDGRARARRRSRAPGCRSPRRAPPGRPRSPRARCRARTPAPPPCTPAERAAVDRLQGVDAAAAASPAAARARSSSGEVLGGRASARSSAESSADLLESSRKRSSTNGSNCVPRPSRISSIASLDGQGAAVHAVGRDRVEDVPDRRDPALERNRFASQAARVALAVVALVVRPGDLAATSSSSDDEPESSS